MGTKSVEKGKMLLGLIGSSWAIVIIILLGFIFCHTAMASQLWNVNFDSDTVGNPPPTATYLPFPQTNVKVQELSVTSPDTITVENSFGGLNNKPVKVVNTSTVAGDGPYLNAAADINMATSGTLIFEWDATFSSTDPGFTGNEKGASYRFYGISGALFVISYQGNGYIGWSSSLSSTAYPTYTQNTPYHFKVILNLDTKTVDIIFNGTTVVNNSNYDNSNGGYASVHLLEDSNGLGGGIHTYSAAVDNLSITGTNMTGVRNAADFPSIQAAIDDLPATGGMVFIPAGTYNLTAPIRIDKSNTFHVAIRGASRRATILKAPNSSTDIFVIGKTGADVAYDIDISDLTLYGGAKALRLNNTFGCRFERIDIIGGPEYGIYAEGTNESHTFNEILVAGARINGISVGNLNGGSGWPVIDYPEMQKCMWNKIRVAGTANGNPSGGAAIKIDAGVFGGSQQTSGGMKWTHIVLEDNHRGGFYISHSTMISLDMVGTESTSLAGEGLYDDIYIKDSNVFIQNSMLGGNVGGRPRYYIRADGGIIQISGVYITSQAMSGKAISINTGLGGSSIRNCVFGYANENVEILGNSIGKTFLYGLVDGAGNPILNTEIPSQLTVVKSLSNTTTGAKNLRGQATLSAGTGSLAVTFPTAEPDASYYIQLTGDGNDTLWVTNKTATGFTINRSATTGTRIVDWLLVR